METSVDTLLENDLLEEINVNVTPLGGLVILKIFVPPDYNGAYLVFKPGGEPMGVINEKGANIIRGAQGVSAYKLIADNAGNINPDNLDAVLVLLQQGILVVNDKVEDIYWITPDKEGGTRHTGKGADLFINYFYTYFGSVFYEGSTLIDSDCDFLSIVEKYFPASPGLTCLDAGCGSGFYASALARKGNTVFGCDISQTRLDACAHQLQAPGKIEVVLCNLEDIPLPDACIDFAMCNFVLEHVADPYAVMDEITRLLKPGGYFLFSVPSFNIRDTLAAWLHGEMPSLNFEHLRSYGLFPKTHPWCEPTINTFDYLNKKGITTEVVQGINILNGLWEPWRSSMHSIASQLGESFSVTWPWNCLGQQTIFLGKKTTNNGTSK